MAQWLCETLPAKVASVKDAQPGKQYIIPAPRLAGGSIIPSLNSAYWNLVLS
jgi:hypothetical protein